jgi:hypothetical protein
MQACQRTGQSLAASVFFGVEESGSPSRARTYDKAINSRLLYQLSYRGTLGGAPYTATFGSCKPLMLIECSKLQIMTPDEPETIAPKKAGSRCGLPVEIGYGGVSSEEDRTS